MDEQSTGAIHLAKSGTSGSASRQQKDCALGANSGAKFMIEKDMSRDGAIIFSDLIGKLDVLRVACEKCERAGRYRLDRLELFNERGKRIKKSI